MIKVGLQSVTFYSGLTILLLGLYGHPIVMAGWLRKPTAQQDCTVGQQCCAVLPDDTPGVYLNVPEGTAITGALSYGGPPGTLFDATSPVIVMHYDKIEDTYEDYFTMHHERKGVYYNRIYWRGDEIARYGQLLAVCVIQKSLVGPSPGSSTFTLEAFAEVPV